MKTHNTAHTRGCSQEYKQTCVCVLFVDVVRLSGEQAYLNGAA